MLDGFFDVVSKNCPEFLRGVFFSGEPGGESFRVVPHQRMTSDQLMVSFGEVDQGIRHLEIKTVLLGMNGDEFEFVFRSQDGELFGGVPGVPGIGIDMLHVDGRAEIKSVVERGNLDRNGVLGSGCGQAQEEKRQEKPHRKTLLNE